MSLRPAVRSRAGGVAAGALALSLVAGGVAFASGTVTTSDLAKGSITALKPATGEA